MPRATSAQRAQRTVVVEHLLELRDRPLRVDRVPAETAAQLVVDAAIGHASERGPDDSPRLLVAVASPGAQAEFELGRMREFRRAAEAAMLRIERVPQPLQRLRRGMRGSASPRPGSRRAICSRGCRYAAATRGSSSANPGGPWRPCFGGYVLAKNGAPAGVRNVVSGQPPERRVISVWAVWQIWSRSGRSSRSTLMLTKSAFVREAAASSANDSCAVMWHQWHAE